MAKTIPERRCVGCGKSFPKKSLIRIVRTTEGGIELDPTGKKNGRGAYICKSSACFKAAVKKKRFSANLGIDITPEIAGNIAREIEAASEEGDG